MSAMTRREFFRKTATDAALAALLAAGATRASASPLGLPIGSQTYPHRDRIVKGDFAGLLKDMKALGIEVIELCNPAYKEFSSLADGKQTRKILDDNGMKCLSAHFTMASLRQEQGTADRVGAGARHDHDEHGDPQRPRDQRHDDARGSEAGRR